MKKCAFWLLATAVGALAAEPPLKISALESGVCYVRAGQVADNFAELLRAAEPTNHVSGTVLDLRFADGTSAGNAAEYFSRRKMPLVILVNSQTRGAAVTLVAQLRASASAMVIGSTNTPGKIVPDIAVAVNADDERKFQENPCAVVGTNRNDSLSATNNLLAFVDHMSEAELVRKRVKDSEVDTPIAMPRVEPSAPVIRDPALARAVDLFKALAVLHRARG